MICQLYHPIMCIVCCIGRYLTGFITGFIWLACCTQAFALELEDIPVPHGTQIQIISSNVVQNGRALSLATYESSLSVEETAEFYRTLWADKSDEKLPGMLETQTEQWLMLSRVRDGFNTVIQLRQSEPLRGSGFVSIMALASSGQIDDQALQIPGLQLLSSTASQDGPRSSVMSVYTSTEPVESASKQFSQFLYTENWQLQSVQIYEQNTVMLLNRQSSQIEVVINEGPAGGTLIVMNEVSDRG